MEKQLQSTDTGSMKVKIEKSGDSSDMLFKCSKVIRAQLKKCEALSY